MFPPLALILFALGATVASFVGVVSGRLYTGQSMLVSRSRCDACNTPLSPLSLVPVVSYIFSGGRAACCGARISLFAPLTELLLGGLFVLAYLRLDLSFALLGMLIALSLLLALVLYDFAHQILPQPLLAVFVVVAFSISFASVPSLTVFRSIFLIALLIGASLALIHFASSGRAMGLADAPLAFGLALLVGHAALPGFIFSFWIGALFGIILLLKRPAGSRMGVEVPFAPYLAAGFLLAYFTQWNPFAFTAALSSTF